MGWFGSTAPPEKEAKKVDEYKPLDRTERQACWEARDTYFACLDQNRILDALKDPETARRKCHREGEAFERDCAASWVKYFKQKRVSEWEKDQKLRRLEADGAVPAREAEKPWWKVW